MMNYVGLTLYIVLLFYEPFSVLNNTLIVLTYGISL